MREAIAPPETPAREYSPKRARKIEPIIRRTLILAILFGQIAFHFSRPNVYLDPDIWWHLATGRWIVQQHALPVTDPFSAYGEDRPWVAYTWLFDLLSYGAYALVGLAGIEFVKTIVVSAFALVLYLLLFRLSQSFGLAVVLTATVLWACLPLATPRPWLFTILLFTLELAVLTELRNQPGKKIAVVVPVIFAIWANLHVQFVYGLVLIGFFLLEALHDSYRGNGRVAPHKTLRSRLRLLLRGGNNVGLYAALLVLSAAAACLNPYGLRIYRTVWDYANQASIYLLIQDLSPPDFRSPTHWLFLGLILGAAFSLGRRHVSVLAYLLLGFGLFSGLRMQRDVWLGAVAGALVLAGWPSGRPERFDAEWNARTAVTGVIAFASMVIVLLVFRVPEAALTSEVSKHYPVHAVSSISSRSLSGPMFNDFGWGGYLAWSLPSYKVSMDGRTNVHSAERVLTSYRTWSGRPEWSSDPDLKKARLILAPRNQPLVSILRLDPACRVIYEDDLAVVFAKRAGE